VPFCLFEFAVPLCHPLHTAETSTPPQGRKLLQQAPADFASLQLAGTDGAIAGLAMANAILGTGSGVVIESATYTGAPEAAGILAFGSNHALHPYFRPRDGSQPSAVVLTTGTAVLAADVQNASPNSGTSSNLVGAPAYLGFAGGPLRDLSLLTMRLRATRTGSFLLKFVFASEVRVVVCVQWHPQQRCSSMWRVHAKWAW
jgi:hypothetical protein